MTSRRARRAVDRQHRERKTRTEMTVTPIVKAIAYAIRHHTQVAPSLVSCGSIKYTGTGEMMPSRTPKSS